MTGGALGLGVWIAYSNSNTEGWKYGASDPLAGITDGARFHKTSLVPTPSFREPYLQYCNSPTSLKSLNGDSMEGKLPFEQQGNFKLLQVFMLARHGDRMPAYSFPNMFATPRLNCNLPYLWGNRALQVNEIEFKVWDLNNHKFASQPLRLKQDQRCNIGSLTSRGHEQHFILGQHFKQAYKKWFNQPQNPTNWTDFLFVHSTNVQRTMFSAASFLHGFLPKGALYRSISPIHISKGVALHGVPPGTNVVYQWCRKLSSISAKALSSEEIKAGHLFYSNVLDRVAAVLGVSKDKLPPKVTQLYDQVMVRVCHNLTLPCNPNRCMDSTLLADLADYADWTNIRTSPAAAKVLMMQPFVYNVLVQQMNSAIEKERQGRSDYLKFLFHFCHDTTLIPFLSSMSAQLKKWPPYASRVVLELWKKEMLSPETSAEASYYVRLLYNGRSIMSELGFSSANFEQNHELLEFSAWSKYITTGEFRAKESYDRVCGRVSA